MWFVFDSALVLLMVLETWVMSAFLLITGAGASGGLGNASILRMARLMRLTRMARMARLLRSMPELFILVKSIGAAMRCMLVTLCMLLLVIYIFSIMFTQAATDYSVAVDLGDLEPTMNSDLYRELHFYWGSLLESMLALFMSISGGVSWVEVSIPLRKIETSWLILFLIYIGFVYFAVLNVVTGVFCQAAIESQQHDQEAMLQSFLSNKAMYTQRFKQLFKSIDTDNSGVITRKEFEEHIEDSQVQVYFAMLGLEPTDARTLFSLLDEDEDVREPEDEPEDDELEEERKDDVDDLELEDDDRLELEDECEETDDRLLAQSATTSPFRVHSFVFSPLTILVTHMHLELELEAMIDESGSFPSESFDGQAQLSSGAASSSAPRRRSSASSAKARCLAASASSRCCLKTSWSW